MDAEQVSCCYVISYADVSCVLCIMMWLFTGYDSPRLEASQHFLVIR